MAEFSVLRHTFSTAEIDIIKAALIEYNKNPKVEGAHKHHAAAVLSYCNSVHRMSISYVTQTKKD